MRLSSTVAGLGTPDTDGEFGVVRTPSGHQQKLVWNAAQGAWVGKPALSMTTMGTIGLSVNGDYSRWKYPGASSESPVPWPNPTAHGFFIQKVIGGGELWAAGLRLQEHLSGKLRTFGTSTGEPIQIALAWYPLASGDSFLSPESFNHGVRLVGRHDDGVLLPVEYGHWFSSGWQNTVLTVDPELTDHLYPEIYALGRIGNIWNFTAYHRWVAGTIGGTGGSDLTTTKPADVDSLISWYDASTIPVADGQPVASWTDWSGRGLNLVQTDTNKQPVVMTESGRRFVRFDGTDDALARGATNYSFVQPTTMSIVLRQRNAGGTQQVWTAPSGSGSPLFYRDDNTDKVNLWLGGSDITYNRGQAWSVMPFTVFTVVYNGATSTIYENGIQKVQGNAGAAGFNGLTVGSGGAGALPAAIDVAEIVMQTGVLSGGALAAEVSRLTTKYALS